MKTPGRRVGLFVAGVVSIASVAGAAGAPGVPSTETEKTSYSVGYQIGGDFKKQGVELSSEMLVQGIRDAIDEASPRMSLKEMRQTLVTLKANITAAERKRKGGIGLAADPQAEQAFLDQNRAKEGVVTLPSGLQYKVVREGAGKTPTAGDNVLVNFRGTMPAGNEFYDSKKAGKPAELSVGALIPGLQEALTRMKEGAFWQIVIPPALGYREGSPLEGKTVLFDIDLLQVKPSR
ncbi:MAG TPA: FKBP-type peptidyl-prolyl cis-trans isomerase N-terminal domain-containing protein [Candidatus Deferrimicrobiaceae bacterium]